MTNLPNTSWPLMETWLGNDVLQKNLSTVPSSLLAPHPSNVFKALELTKPEDVKVLIVGQDPYIKGEAHGLAFSSMQKMTPSLKIVFKELEIEYGTRRFDTDLTSWAEQGVLLLNTILTTELGKTLAHGNFGWQQFTTEVARYVINLGNPLAVMLWGVQAQEFWAEVTSRIDVPLDKILLLNACHPQAENYGSAVFTGCGHFQQANHWLVQHDKTPINWIK